MVHESTSLMGLQPIHSNAFCFCFLIPEGRCVSTTPGGVFKNGPFYLFYNQEVAQQKDENPEARQSNGC